jgi:dCMP deaminase
MPRIPIDIIYMQTAYQFAKLSYANRRKVGCVIIKDKQMISFGYNGMPYGFDNQCEEDDIRYYENPDSALDLMEDGYVCDNGCCKKEHAKTRREVLHAESNAIMKVAKSTMNCNGAELYTTTCPCFDCAKLIIQAGITKVYYSEDYRDMSGVELLKKAGIEVKEVICWNEL